MLCMGAALSLSMNAQDPWLGLVAETEHTEGDLAGMTTYRLYVYTQNADDFVVSCSGDDENPLYLTSTSEPAWFQHELATTALATDVNPAFFASFPEFAYDSWLTIGAEDNTASADVIDLADPDYDAFAIFEAGQNVAVETTVGNAWFVLPIPHQCGGDCRRRPSCAGGPVHHVWRHFRSNPSSNLLQRRQPG